MDRRASLSTLDREPLPTAARIARRGSDEEVAHRSIRTVSAHRTRCTSAVKQNTISAVGSTCLRACQITARAAWLPGQRTQRHASSRVWRRKSVDLPRTGRPESRLLTTFLCLALGRSWAALILLLNDQSSFSHSKLKGWTPSERKKVASPIFPPLERSRVLGMRVLLQLACVESHKRVGEPTGMVLTCLLEAARQVTFYRRFSALPPLLLFPPEFMLPLDRTATTVIGKAAGRARDASWATIQYSFFPTCSARDAAICQPRSTFGAAFAYSVTRLRTCRGTCPTIIQPVLCWKFNRLQHDHVVSVLTWSTRVSTDQRQEKYCEEALNRQPVAFCRSAHTPTFTDVDESDGVCPDRNKVSKTCKMRFWFADGGKHPPAPGEAFFSVWSGITTTSGEGNDWYRRQNQGQTSGNFYGPKTRKPLVGVVGYNAD
ncbi:uncharacterized protein MYCFIDRAFT_178341 [Pseudocercospora fijiensis CIRAD86]|uniref:Uncharacterized protein n=1 Tax=Pseudocercospora fijiensis (strain CIRAD86) TaxID=383855 RepID=M3A5A8_PSEFD|nr:uncharacterized protein MYCFIDRAFT_178341 [Pseudocercospora fijiensis CIRAD86]EME79786.1 hypothetical protein MYCFIDRAFT_178341 [Pseudocercospora fijiensis CIRAD86]